MVILTMVQKCVWGTVGRIRRREERERKGYGGVKRVEFHCTYTYEDSQ
jgi:hypothetical protein